MLYDNNFKNYEKFVLTVSIFFMNKISMVLWPNQEAQNVTVSTIWTEV